MAVVDAVLAALGLPPARATTRMSGYDATVWRAELTDGPTVAVRLLRPGRSLRREVDALRLAAEHGHPVPAITATGRYDERDVIVTSWCRGRTIGELVTESVAESVTESTTAGSDLHTLGRLFGQAQAGLHRPLDRSGAVLCHLDFQPFNVLVDGGEVTGIVDWANARVDDSRADLAWTRVVLDLAPAVRPDLAAGLEPFVAAWREGYTTTRPMPDDAELAPFLADAARRQLSDWQPRVTSGECPPAVLKRAQAIVSASAS